MAIIETLTADQVQPHTATSRHHAGPVVQVTWVDWEAPADTWTAVAKQIGVGVLTWAEGQGPTSAVPVLYLDQEDGSAEWIGLGEIVRIETPHGERSG